MLDVRTHTDGGQTAEAVGERVVAWICGRARTLDLALYDVRLPGAVGDARRRTRSAPRRRAACACGSPSTRTSGREDDGPRPFFPAPPRTEPHVLETLGVPVKPIPGWRDLMHHKYVVRDGAGALDRLDELDAGLVHAAGERRSPRWRRRRRGRVHARLRAAVGERPDRRLGRLRHRAGRTASGRGSAPAAARSCRTGSRSGSAPRAGACGSRRRCSPPGRSSARWPR